MIRYEHALKLQQLQMALTIVIGNDIIIPIVEQRETVLAATMIYGFILKCRDYMTNSDLQVALMHARKIAKNKNYRTFMKIKDSIGYKVIEV